MDILKRLIPILCSPLLTGCYSDFEPNIDSTPLLCMNAVIDADREFTVQLAHSWRYDDYDAYKDDHTVTDAQIDVYADDHKVCEATYTRWTEETADGVIRRVGGYRIPYSPKAGQLISLHASSPEYGEAEASVTIPLAPLTGSIQVDSTVQTENYQFDDYVYQDFRISLNIGLPVTDRPGLCEYYQLAWEAISPDGGNYELNCGNPDYDMEPIFSEHIDAMETVFGSDSWGFTVFSDRSFSGSTYPLRIIFRNILIHRVTGNGPLYTTHGTSSDNSSLRNGALRLTLFSLDRNLYNWYMYDWHENESFIGLLGNIGMAESTVAYSNVSTRAGLVVARNRSVIDITLKPF